MPFITLALVSAFALCSTAPRVSCVVDGDTFWLQGEKIRIAELEPGTRDRDRYGRLLRTVRRNGRSLGAVLIAEGLAEPWRGRRSDWCALDGPLSGAR